MLHMNSASSTDHHMMSEHHFHEFIIIWLKINVNIFACGVEIITFVWD